MELYPHMPRVQSEIIDRNLVIRPTLQGKRVVVLGAIDVDGHGWNYSTSEEPEPTFITPGSVLPFNELIPVADLSEFSRSWRANPAVGDTDEITPTLAEIAEQGTTNLSFMRLDMAMVDSTSGPRGVLQSTGLPPQEWIDAMNLGTTEQGSGDYIASTAYRNWVIDLLELSDIDVSTEAVHQDPTDADLRYYALGKALNNLIGEDIDVVIFACPPGYINPARTKDELGIYPIRPDIEVTGSDAIAIRERGAPTINNPFLQGVILETDPDSEDYLQFKGFELISGTEGVAKRNFAHLLANFCFWQSYYEKSCNGFIGTEPIDINFDGRITHSQLQTYIGRERTQVDQFIDDVGGTPLAANGTGLLGFVDCEEFDGIHRLHATPDYPINYKFWASVLGMECIQRSIQENVVFNSTGYGDSYIEDSINGQLMDLGARIRVCTNDVFVVNRVSQRYNLVRGAYLTNGAASIAGYYANKPQGVSLTKRKLRNVYPLRRMSQTQLDALLKARFIPLQTVTGEPVAEVQADDTGAFHINAHHRSDFVRGSSLDALDTCIEDIRKVAKPVLGTGLNASQVEHLKTEAEEALKQRKKTGEIQAFEFNILSTEVMQILGEAEFELKVVPAFEVRKIRIRSGLAKPSSALVASAAG